MSKPQPLNKNINTASSGKPAPVMTADGKETFLLQQPRVGSANGSLREPARPARANGKGVNLGPVINTPETKTHPTSTTTA